MKKYSACEDIYPAVECRDNSENRADIFNMISIDGDVELYIASEVDEELRKTKHALWMAWAEWARAMIKFFSLARMWRNANKWKWVECKCLQKAKEYV